MIEMVRFFINEMLEFCKMYMLNAMGNSLNIKSFPEINFNKEVYLYRECDKKIKFW